MRFVSSLLLAALGAATEITMAPSNTDGTPIAIVWIQGAFCNNSQYQEIAQTVQDQGAQSGQSIWVCLPSFASGAPDPVTIIGKVNTCIDDLTAMGFSGDNIVMAGHSLGGAMAQNYTADNPDKIKAQVLMGSVLTREKREIRSDGTTKWNYQTPTMALGGTKDGLMRITRVAESFWHTNMNIMLDQSQMFPTIAFQGVSHAQFMSGTPPPNVKDKDLVPDVSYETAHLWVAEQMVAFFGQHLMGGQSLVNINGSYEVMKPIIQALELEGYYETKPACDNRPYLVNPDDPTCLHGSSWNMRVSQPTMGGTLPNPTMFLLSNDNFHDVQETNPVHLAEIDTTCEVDSENCIINAVTVTQNYYGDYDPMDTGYHPQSASEMKSKMSSRQKVQISAGRTDVSFEVEDEIGNRCADINDEAIAWAYNNLLPEAKSNYDQFGIKLVTGDDLGPYNKGPDWIWTYMAYTPSADGSQMIVQSPTMRTPVDYIVPQAAGFHYCKVLSPFKAIEWMMLDGLYENNGIKNQSALFLQ